MWIHTCCSINKREGYILLEVHEPWGSDTRTFLSSKEKPNWYTLLAQEGGKQHVWLCSAEQNCCCSNMGCHLADVYTLHTGSASQVCDREWLSKKGVPGQREVWPKNHIYCEDMSGGRGRAITQSHLEQSSLDFSQLSGSYIKLIWNLFLRKFESWEVPL